MATESVDDYLALLPSHLAEGLQAVRRSLLSAFPDARESMRLEMPTYDVGENWFSMAAGEDGTTFYLGDDPDSWEQSAFESYAREKSALKIAASEPVPVEAILSAVEDVFRR